MNNKQKMTPQDAIKWVENRMCFGRFIPVSNNRYEHDECHQAGVIAIEALKQKAERDWIPFTEAYDEEEGRVMFTCRLPGDEEEILVTDGRHVWEDTFMNDGMECWLDSSNRPLVEEVTAWMPKPEPYKRSEEE